MKGIACNINRAEDLVARYGGEEFAIILGNSDSNSIVTLSVGVASVIPNSDLTLQKQRTRPYIPQRMKVETV